MKLRIFSFVLALGLLAFSGCQTVPVTGRRQLSLIPAGELMSMSAQQYSQVLRESKLSTDTRATAMVRRVGDRIQRAVERYMNEQGMSEQLKGFAWEFNVVDDNQVNAWCMPGGKVVVYTGILPVCQDEAGLAIVMGHEIAHAVAHHGDERLSQNMMATFGQAALAVAMSNKPQTTQALWMQAYGMGAQLGVLLPFSRRHESEADEIGLIFSSMAGYDPREAPKFWQRMAAAGGGRQVPEFLSTHPSNETRIRDLEAMVPKAMEIYNASAKQ